MNRCPCSRRPHRRGIVCGLRPPAPVGAQIRAIFRALPGGRAGGLCPPSRAPRGACAHPRRYPRSLGRPLGARRSAAKLGSPRVCGPRRVAGASSWAALPPSGCSMALRGPCGPRFFPLSAPRPAARLRRSCGPCGDGRSPPGPARALRLCSGYLRKASSTARRPRSFPRALRAAFPRSPESTGGCAPRLGRPAFVGSGRRPPALSALPPCPGGIVRRGGAKKPRLARQLL